MKLKNKTILMIEDDLLVGKMYERRLMSDGARVLWASSGKDGLKMLEKETPDLIVTDLMLPKMTGYELVDRLNKNKKVKDIPVIILTNITDRPEDAKKIKELGIAEYIVKSDINLIDLVKIIGKHISNDEQKKKQKK